MDHTEVVRKALRRQIKAYKTQTAYAKTAGVTPQYISQLLKGQNDIASLSLEMLERLFPDIIELHFNWDKKQPVKERFKKILSVIMNTGLTDKQKQLLLEAFFPELSFKEH